MCRYRDTIYGELKVLFMHRVDGTRDMLCNLPDSAPDIRTHQHTQTHTQRQTDRHRHTHTHTHTHTQTQTQTHTHTDTHTHTGTDKRELIHTLQ